MALVGLRAVVAVWCFLALPAFAADGSFPAQKEGNFTIANFKFGTGEVLPELRLHYYSIGTPHRTKGKIDNAVLLLHGTGGSGAHFLKPPFSDAFAPGGVLDANKYYIIMPDSIGSGKSSKPSDGLRMKFPSYDYDDMVRAQYALVREKLGIDRLRLILGTSMGCMHAFVWGMTYPDAMDAMLPMSCEAVRIAGRNRLHRKAMMEAVRNDPAWKNGDYAEQPQGAIRTLAYLTLMATETPIQLQQKYPSPEAADKAVADAVVQMASGFDANNFLYAINTSRNYNPSPKLDQIKAHVLWLNAADDFSNPAVLGLSARQVKKIKNAKLVILPPDEESHGHSSYKYPALWGAHLAELLANTPHQAP